MQEFPFLMLVTGRDAISGSFGNATTGWPCSRSRGILRRRWG